MSHVSGLRFFMSWFAGKKKILNFLLPLILALVFFSLSSQTARRARWYESALLNLLTPFELVVTSISNAVASVWDGYVVLIGVAQDNERLRRTNATLEGQLVRTEEMRQENERLRSLLAYKEAMSYPTVVAEVIANDPRSEFKSVTINKGIRDGVDTLMPVIGPKGLVGRIGRVFSRTAQVLLITDPNSAVDVFIERSRARAVLVGAARRTQLRAGYYLSRLEYLTRVSDVKEGDVVVTSGFDQIYPAGIPVGSLHDVIASRYGVFQEADVVPFEDFPEVTEVLVLLKPPSHLRPGGS